jgi:CBS domain-containing protein
MQTVDQVLAIKGSEVFSVTPQDSVLHAIEVMATKHVGALLVMAQGSLVGIISERDYARKVILKNRSSHDTPVNDIMTSPAVSVTPEHTRASVHAADDRGAIQAPAGGTQWPGGGDAFHR